MTKKTAQKPKKTPQKDGEKKLRAGEKRTARFVLEGTVTAAEFSEILGLTDETLRKYAAQGMPKASRGRYPLRDATRWIMALNARRASEKETAGPTRADVDRDYALLKLKKAQGDVFDRQEVFDTWAGAHARLGVAMEQLATKIGRELNLPGDDVKMIRDMTDEARRQYVTDCAEFIDPVEPDADAGSKAA